MEVTTLMEEEDQEEIDMNRKSQKRVRENTSHSSAIKEAKKTKEDDNEQQAKIVSTTNPEQDMAIMHLQKVMT